MWNILTLRLFFQGPQQPLIYNWIIYWGANTIKWTIVDPCVGLTESDSKLYTNFEVCEERIHKHLKTFDLQSQAIYDDKKQFQEKSTIKKMVQILGGALHCQVEHHVW